MVWRDKNGKEMKMVEEQRQKAVKEGVSKLFALKKEYEATGGDINIVDNTSPKAMGFIREHPDAVSLKGTFAVYDSELLNVVKKQMDDSQNLLLVAYPQTDEMKVYTVHIDDVDDSEDEYSGSSSSGGSGGGCFIATAVFDSPYSPEVELLRKFRDNILLNSLLGRMFVKLYYVVSPPIATLITKTKFLKPFLKAYFFKPLLNAIRRR
jgi:hypothetical protein